MVTSVWLYLGFLLLLGAERVVELFLSRRNARRAFSRGGVEVGQGHFRLMALMHTTFLFACAAEVLLFERAFPGSWGWAAFALALCAQGLRYWAIATLGEKWNVRIIFVPGDEPVTSGPYRYIRHPNYVAVVAELLVVPLIHGAFLTAVLFTVANAFVLSLRIRAEERALGAAYATAFAERPRFVPASRRP